MHFEILKHNYTDTGNSITNDNLLIIYQDLPPSSYVVQKLLEEKIGIPALRKWYGDDPKLENNHNFCGILSENQLLEYGLTDAESASRVVYFLESERDIFEMIEKDKNFLSELIVGMNLKYKNKNV